MTSTTAITEMKEETLMRRVNVTNKMTNKMEDIEVQPLARPSNLYDLGVRRDYRPTVIVDMPLLSRLSDRVPTSLYRLGLIHVDQRGLEKPQSYSFVRSSYEPPLEGKLYVAAIDQESRRYWALAQIVPRAGPHSQQAMQHLIGSAKPKELAQLIEYI